jgi:hypothetical protein
LFGSQENGKITKVYTSIKKPRYIKVDVAQWLERLSVEQEAGGSNPLIHPNLIVFEPVLHFYLLNKYSLQVQTANHSYILQSNTYKKPVLFYTKL